MPPEFSTGCQDPAATAETTRHVQKQTVKSAKMSGAHYLSILAAAADAVRSGLQALPADPSSLQTQAANATHYMQQQQVQTLLASADFVPIRDCALWIFSLRHMPTDAVDFGGGKARSVMGCLMPATTRAVNVTAGPDGTGLICVIRLPKRCCSSSAKPAARTLCSRGTANHLAHQVKSAESTQTMRLVKHHFVKVLTVLDESYETHDQKLLKSCTGSEGTA